MLKRKFSPHVFWTHEEDQIIRELYPTEAPLSLIREKLPRRNRSQIQNHANWMGIVRPVRVRRTQEEIREAKRVFMARKRAEDPEKARKYHRERHHKNREKNVEKMRQYAGRRFFWVRAMHLRGVGRASTKDIAQLWKAQRGLCALTGIRLDRTAQLDHILPKARGGMDEIGNLRWLCRDVNIAKRDMTDGEFVGLCRSVMNWIGKRIQEAI